MILGPTGMAEVMFIQLNSLNPSSPSERLGASGTAVDLH